MTVARGIAQLVNGNYNTDSIMKFYPEAAQTFKNVFYYPQIQCAPAFTKAGAHIF